MVWSKRNMHYNAGIIGIRLGHSKGIMRFLRGFLAVKLFRKGLHWNSCSIVHTTAGLCGSIPVELVYGRKNCASMRVYAAHCVSMWWPLGA